MTLRAAGWRSTKPSALPPGLAARASAPVAVAACAATLAVFVAYAGFAALLAPVYIAAIVGSVAYPRQAAFVLGAVATVFEPDAIDFTRPLSFALYDWTPAI